MVTKWIFLMNFVISRTTSKILFIATKFDGAMTSTIDLQTSMEPSLDWFFLIFGLVIIRENNGEMNKIGWLSEQIGNIGPGNSEMDKIAKPTGNRERIWTLHINL